ncbi:C13 family peptidase [Allohahella marinimesophila]|uniref:Peptidase C13 family protein n=1 Tax=Allohahella marinimesophila TaxID=1054972 RepID=A0ABP7NJT9_9GAMM
MLPTLLYNLIAGLRLVLFRPFGQIGFRYSMTAFWSIVLLNLLLVAGLQKAGIDEPVLLQAEGIFPEAFFILLVLLSGYLISRCLGSRLLQFRFPVIFLNAAFWMQLISGLYKNSSAGGTLAWALYWLIQLWLLLVIFRVLKHAARADCEGAVVRRWLAGLAFAIVAQSPQYFLYPFEFWVPARYALAEASGEAEDLPMLNAEAVLTSQTDLLKQQLLALEPSKPGEVDAYFLGYAPWGDQKVFANEVRFARKRFDDSFGTRGRSLSLINDGDNVDTQALAISSNLAASLQWLGRIAQPKEDVLYLFITSHGGENHDIGTVLANLPLNDLPAAGLASLLASSGFKWKVVIVSSCYSGGHIPLLADDTTMVITASRADRTSFGCTDDAEYTYFGRAFLVEALENNRDFQDAFELARVVIARREATEGFTPSEPQIAVGGAIEAYLEEALTVSLKQD